MLQLVSPGDYPFPVKASGVPDNSALRAWCWAHAIYIAEFGPIPMSAIDAWRDAHRDQIEKAPLVKVIVLT
jgi:hypothetical protein